MSHSKCGRVSVTVLFVLRAVVLVDKPLLVQVEKTGDKMIQRVTRFNLTIHADEKGSEEENAADQCPLLAGGQFCLVIQMPPLARILPDRDAESVGRGQPGGSSQAQPKFQYTVLMK